MGFDLETQCVLCNTLTEKLEATKIIHQITGYELPAWYPNTMRTSMRFPYVYAIGKRISSKSLPGDSEVVPFSTFVSMFGKDTEDNVTANNLESIL